MAVWKKKEVAREVVKELHERYSCDLLTASILARRGITNGEDIMYYLENDPRYLHSPFLFSAMEDAVDRILAARDEGEKVLVFGDRDADGITSTTILYECLTELGMDVQWKIPVGNDAYGLTMAAVDQFAKDYGTLIITVDCGISNNVEIAHAVELGVEVIVVDHHNPQEELPHAIILNPKMPDCGYPFKDLSGCGVTYKLVSALRFAQNELYKQEICLLNVRPANEVYIIEGIKIVNCCETARIAESIVPGVVSITQTRLLDFLQGQQIFVWDEPLQKKMLAKAFGTGVEFNMLDIRPEVGKIIPAVANLSLVRLAGLSKIVKYKDMPPSELDGFFNIFVTFVQKKIESFSPRDKQDLQLVMLATLADLMPLQNENRILVKQGLAIINSEKPRPGLLELLSRQNLLGKKIGTVDLAWNVIPLLNATGRLGKPELGIQLFLETDDKTRNDIADQIVQMNKDRRQLGTDAWPLIQDAAYKSFEQYNKHLVFVADERIHRGVTGILAGKICQTFKVPAMLATLLEEGHWVGSMRSVKGYDVTSLLEQCADLFINHGGHNYAAGFSFVPENLAPLQERLRQLAPLIEFSEEDLTEKIDIDAELPHDYLNPDLLNLIDSFEPYGEGNQPLTFLSKNMKIAGADIMGKIEVKHLKLTLQCGKYKWPALYWSASHRLNKDFSLGDAVDAVFQIGRNTFNGNETAQMVITDMEIAK